MSKNILLIILGSIISTNIYSQNIDINILKNININRNKDYDAAFNAISNSESTISIATPLIIYSVGAINKDITLKKKGVFIAETAVVSALLATSFKYAIKRERPYVLYPDLDNVASSDSPSFPSGHTSQAFATATSLSIAFPKWYVITPSFLWAGSVAYSRLHLGVHYPSDVFAGAVLGSLSAYLTLKLNALINKRYQKNIPDILL